MLCTSISIEGTPVHCCFTISSVCTYRERWLPCIQPYNSMLLFQGFYSLECTLQSLTGRMTWQCWNGWGRMWVHWQSYIWDSAISTPKLHVVDCNEQFGIGTSKQHWNDCIIHTSCKFNLCSCCIACLLKLQWSAQIYRVPTFDSEIKWLDQVLLIATCLPYIHITYNSYYLPLYIYMLKNPPH